MIRKISGMVMLMLVMLMLVIPALAQPQPEATETPVGMVEAMPEQTQAGTMPDSNPMMEWLPIVLTIAGATMMSVTLLATLAVLAQVAERAGVNISPESIREIATPLAQQLSGAMVELREGASTTLTPYDDIAVNLAQIPVEGLLGYLREQGYVVAMPDDTMPIPDDGGKLTS